MPTQTKTAVSTAVGVIALTALAFSMLGYAAYSAFVGIPTQPSVVKKAPQTAPIKNRVVLEGTLEVLHQDNFEQPQLSQYLYFLRLPNGKVVNLHPTRPIPLISGSKIRVSGIQAADSVAINLDAPDALVTVSEAQLDTLGEQRTLVILAEHPDDPPSAFRMSKSKIEQFFFSAPNSVNAYYQEASYKKIWLTGDVVDWVKVPHLCEDFSSGSPEVILDAVDDFVFFPDYSRLIFIFPTPTVNNCDIGLGSLGKYTFLEGYTDDGQFTASISWLSSTMLETSVAAHEFGHNLGARHANSYDCGNKSIDISGCSSKEYGDYYDVMGTSSSVPAHMNANRKDLFGWFNPENLITLSIPLVPQEYTLAPLESITSLPQVLKIPMTFGLWKTTYYYIEYRQPIGFDADIKRFAPQVYTGALIHIGYPDPEIESLLIDGVPNTGSQKFYDPAVPVGQTFFDTFHDNNIAITPIAITPDKLTVSISPAVQIDIALTRLEINPWTVVLNQEMTAGYRITNQGNASLNLQGVKLKVYKNSVPIVEDLIDATGDIIIEPAAFHDFEYKTMLLSDTAGEFNITLEIDSSNVVQEIDETNNSLSNPIQVIGLSDLIISLLEFSPTQPLHNQEVKVLYTVENKGDAPVELRGAKFRLSKNETMVAEEVITAESMVVQPNTAVDFEYSTTALTDAIGKQTITLEIDSGNIVQEKDEMNNTISAELEVVDLSDLAFIKGAVNPIFGGRGYRYYLVVTNSGSVPSGAWVLQKKAGERDAQTREFPSLAPFEERLVVGAALELPVTFTLDPQNLIKELNEDNNVITLPTSTAQVPFETSGLVEAEGP